MWQPLQQGTGGNYGQQFDRAQQVNELLVAQPMCRAINPDRSLLEVGVRLQDGTLTSLRISLPTGFPTDHPALSITSPVRHPWVDSIGRLAFPLLERWGATPNTRLAAVVAEAFKGLGGQPALPPSKASAQQAAQQQAARPGQQTAQQQQSTAGTAQQQQQQHPPVGSQSSAGRLGAAGSAGHMSMSPAASGGAAVAGGAGSTQGPAIPAAFAEVAALSEEQLSLALVDQAAYQRLVQQAAQRVDVWQEVEKAKRDSAELAAANLAQAEEQAGIRNQMAVVRASDYAPSKAAFDAKWARQQAVLSKLSPDVLMARLREATREAEEEGERLVGQLGGGEVSVEAFVERYTRAQAAYHQRDLKLLVVEQTLPSLGR